MADCKAPVPPAPTDPNPDWAAYFVAYGEYLQCLAANHGTTSIATYLPEINAFEAAAVAWQSHVGP